MSMFTKTVFTTEIRMTFSYAYESRYRLSANALALCLPPCCHILRNHGHRLIL